jgi:hypothetical protein
MYKTQPEKIQRPYEETEGIESDWMASTVIRRNQLQCSGVSGCSESYL